MNSSFAANITAFCNKARLAPLLVMRKVALDSFADCLRISPVRTGRFRGNFRVGLNQADLTIDNINFYKKKNLKFGDAVTGKETVGSQGSIATARLEDVIIISNNLPYATFLNRGGSRQAPAGILPVVVARRYAEISNLVNSIKNM